MPVTSIDQIRAMQGHELGTSAWITIDQARIHQFAEATEDHQFIHTDPELAAQTPFGGTIAHGFLSLSLLSRMAAEVLPVPKTTQMVVNYGLERVRFIAPVRSGNRVRGRFTLTSTEERAPGQLLLRMNVVVEVEGEDRPALTADWLALIFV